MRKMVFVLIGLAACAVAQTQPAPDQRPGFTLKQLAPGVYAAINPDGGRAGSNAGFIVGEDSVAVVDTLIDVAPARELLAEIRKVTDKPIKFVVYTHYYLDHTGGGLMFSEAGATIIAHRDLRGWLRTENVKFFGPTPKPEQEARVKALVEPQITYD
jgi:glyoxylase-like metal-dependent hydrolase (beta-lactamase superfamily II)